MPIKDYMRVEEGAGAQDAPPPARKAPRTWLEVTLALLGFAAWAWCAVQVMRGLL